MAENVSIFHALKGSSFECSMDLVVYGPHGSWVQVRALEKGLTSTKLLDAAKGKQRG